MSMFPKQLCASLVFLFFISFNLSLAEEANQNAINAIKERREELQRQLDIKTGEIKVLEAFIQQKGNEAVSFERDIAIVNAEIKKAKLKIQRLDAEIAKTKTGISQKSEQIIILSAKSEKNKDSLAELIRKNNEIDSTGLAEIILGYQKMSDFFVAEDTLEPVHRLIQDTLDEIRATKKQTEKEKDDLTEYQAEQVQLKAAQEKERKKLATSEEEKKKLLKITEAEKKIYQATSLLKQKDAAKIRSALFALRDTAAISFGEAYGYALEAQKKTGVRPAFLLAILTQESNLGENTGQCLVTNFNTGDGIGKNTGKIFKDIMKPSRDIKPFIDIASRLGFDPKTKPVSCPQTGGYGGGMGPAQFIPSTWAGYEKRISNATGITIPDPWIPRDAFFASSIYLSDLGAGKGTYDTEHKAAARYYAGKNWYKPSGQNYGSSVMEFAADYQEQIDIINKLASR